MEVGTDEGARLVAGGSQATGDGLQHGHFFSPTILDGVRPMDRVAPGGDLRAGAVGHPRQRL